jgi:uncharacterized protein
MTLSMYDASVPRFLHGLSNLSIILTKAVDYAKVKNFEESVLMNARLAPDMFPLSKQVQIACDIVKGGAARLANVEVPSFPDTETTFSDLQERIAKTKAFIITVTASQMNGSEDRAISLSVGGKPMHFHGQDYLLQFVIPNFYFHMTTTYAILRHNGVDIGKGDFLGKIQ